jgi:hypothetical protein
MRQVLITVSRGIIEQVVFFDDPKMAVLALSDYVKGMNPEHDDAALYDTRGMIANAKHFLDDQDEYAENNALIAEVSEERSKPVFIVANPDHRLGFMVTSPDDPLGYDDPAGAVSDLGQLRQDFGNHLKLYRVIPVGGPMVQKTDLEAYNAESVVEDFDYSLVEEYMTRPTDG